MNLIVITVYSKDFLYARLETGRIMWLGMAGWRPHNNFSSVYRIFTKLGHMIPLWKGKNPIYFGVITIIRFDNLYRRAYFVMHTFLVYYYYLIIIKKNILWTVDCVLGHYLTTINSVIFWLFKPVWNWSWSLHSPHIDDMWHVLSLIKHFWNREWQT
jgi:hypothetical protein